MNRLESVFLFWAPVKTGVAVFACRFWNGKKQLRHTALRKAQAWRLALRSVCLCGYEFSKTRSPRGLGRKTSEIGPIVVRRRESPNINKKMISRPREAPKKVWLR